MSRGGDDTRPKQEQSALQISKDRYRHIFQETNDAIIIAEAESGTVVDANRKAEELLGLPREKIIGMRQLDIHPPDDSGKYRMLFNLHARGGYGKADDVEILRNSGEICSVSISASTFMQAGKKYVIDIFHDLTQIRLAQEQVRESEARFRALFEGSGDGIVITDLRGGILDCNGIYEDITGYSLADLRKMNFYQLTPEKWHDWERKEIVEKRVLKTGYSGIYEKEYIASDGRIFPVQIQAHLHRNQAGNPAFMWAVVRDITLEKEAESELKNREEKLRTLLEASMDGIVLASNGHIDYVNDSLLGMLGYDSSGWLQGARLDNLVLADDRQRFSVIIENMQTGKTAPARFDFRGLRADGSVLDCEMSGSTFEIGDAVFFVGFVRDITDRKRREREIRMRLMRHDMQEGMLYIQSSETLVESLDILNELNDVGYESVVFSRTPKEHMTYDMPKEYTHIWLSEAGKGISVKPEPANIVDMVSYLPKSSAILFCSMDYLLTKISRKKLLGLVQKLREMAYLNSHIIIMHARPDCFPGKFMKQLENECMEIRPMVREALPEPLEAILKYVFEQNIVGIKPSYSNIGRNLNMSMPTVRKRLNICLNHGYLIEKKRGRTKILEITEKGRSLFPR